jgi:hypothetical protein
LGAQLSIALGLQGLDQGEQGNLLRWVRLSAYASGFVPKDGSIALLCPLKFDRTTEAPFPMIEPSELMPIETVLPHSLS